MSVNYIIEKCEQVTELSLYKKLSSNPTFFYLDSKQAVSNLEVWSFMGVNPIFSVESKNNDVSIVSNFFKTDRHSLKLDVSVKEIIDKSLLDLKINDQSKIPFLGGWVCALSYEWLCKESQGGIFKKSLKNHSSETECFFSFYHDIYAINKNESSIYRVTLEKGIVINWINKQIKSQTKRRRFQEDVADYVITSDSLYKKRPFNLSSIETSKKNENEKEIPEILSKNAYFKKESLTSNLSKQEYIERVKKVKARIKEGDIYQANVTQKFSAKMNVKIEDLYPEIRKKLEMPFGALIKYGEEAILSTSPERFIKIDGATILTSPIKGTIKSDSKKEQDTINKMDLMTSQKNRAELLMITDLERNDLGQICKTGTVKVKSLIKLESFSYLHHLVSHITGTLKDKLTIMDVILSMSPGGSITGAPKKRAIEILSQLEPCPRRWYTGSLGYIGLNKKCELNIGIRIMYTTHGLSFFHAGGGIVADSEPELEWEESMLKASIFLDLILDA